MIALWPAKVAKHFVPRSGHRRLASFTAMKAFAQIIVAFAPVILAGVFPFVRVLRGGRVWVAFAIGWVSLVAWMFVFCFIIPLVAYQIDPDFAVEVAMHWVPEGPAVVAVTFFGWFYAGIAVLLAMIVRKLVRWFKQRGAQTNTDMKGRMAASLSEPAAASHVRD